MSDSGWVHGPASGWTAPTGTGQPSGTGSGSVRRETGPGTAPGAAPAGAAVATAAPSRPAALPRGPRRIKVTLARLDPWTALKVSFVYGLAGLVVFLVAVSLLYGLIDAMGVLHSLRDFLGQIDSNHTGPGLVAWLGFGRVFLVTLVLGVINVVLLSAIATMGAFIYNVSSEVVGGVDITLIERP